MHPIFFTLKNTFSCLTVKTQMQTNKQKHWEVSKRRQKWEKSLISNNLKW